MPIRTANKFPGQYYKFHAPLINQTLPQDQIISLINIINIIMISSYKIFLVSIPATLFLLLARLLKNTYYYITILVYKLTLFKSLYQIIKNIKNFKIISIHQDFQLQQHKSFNISYNSMATEYKYKGPECVYGKPAYATCIDPACRKPGILCENGYNNKDQCSLFHQSCAKIQWAEVQALVYDNPNLRSPEFHYIRDKVDNLFLNLITKVKAEHAKFRLWVKTYGYSIQVMRFIKNMTQNSFTQVNGFYIHSILQEMNSIKKIQLPKILENEVVRLDEEISELLQRASDLYLKPGTKRDSKSLVTTTTISQSNEKAKPAASVFTSKIVNDVNSITRLFDAKITSFRLLFRASQNSFSIKQFHKKCDNQNNTMLLAQTQFGKIIGGFTPIAWSSAKKQWAADKSLKSFIFSLNMREKFNLNLAQFAIANNPDKGPIFGCCDICIVDNSHKERSNAQFPISYNNGKYIRSAQSSFAFTGHPKGQYLVKEWQIFKLQFE